MAAVPLSEIVKAFSDAIVEDRKPKSKLDQIVNVFLSYVECAHGSWDPTEEDDWSDCVSAIRDVLNTPDAPIAADSDTSG